MPWSHQSLPLRCYCWFLSAELIPVASDSNFSTILQYQRGMTFNMQSPWFFRMEPKDTLFHFQQPLGFNVQWRSYLKEKKGREKTEREQILIVGSLHLSFSFLWLKYEFFYSQTLRLFFCQSELWKGLQRSATAPCQTCSTKPFPWTNSALLSCSDLWLRKSRICPLFPRWFTRELSLIGSDI